MKFYIIDAGCKNNGQGGTLNHSFADLADQTLRGLGHTVDLIHIAHGFEPEVEQIKLLSSDVIIVQTPGWWMSIPWQLKKYLDEVFVLLANGDGRSRSNPDKKYGTGGVLHDKKYLISCTWNAPLEAFTAKDQFFEGRGIDGVFLPLHKTFEFIGMQKLPTFMANDVLKNPQIEADFKRYEEHLTKLFSEI